MGADEVVIPSTSVKDSDEDNIVAFGPMMGYNTSFEIPNGEAEQYMKAWNTLGIQDLEIKFYDKGYTKLRNGLESTKKISVVLLIVGITTTFLILIFFCYILIVKQKKRTAIERSLGTSKSRCTISLLAGILFIVIIGSTVGTMAGFWLTDKSADLINKETFNTIYSSWAVNSQTENQVEIDKATSAATSVVTGGMIIFVSILIALAGIRLNLKSEPLKLLSTRER
ncbi:FtsX-like permease family protein [Paenibacillus sp. sgz500958]|uniref:FtsX-like permease family protein n=1 Tax=Paenibacillus sp. sgz500958 TaxID=3242475 RepID=UPI0036D2624A